MAIVWNEGWSPTAGPGEAEVKALLKRELPDSFTLINNITIPYRDGCEECDLIAVGPDLVFMIEVKSRRGHLEIFEQELIKDGIAEANPFMATRIKAQKLKSRFEEKLGWDEARRVWVQPIVVVPRIFDPAKVYRVDSMADKVVFMDEIIELLRPPSKLTTPRFHGQVHGDQDRFVGIITGGARARGPKMDMGDYQIVSEILRGPNDSFILYRADHKLTGARVLLEVVADPQRVKGIVEMVRLIPPSPVVHLPRHVFDDDDGRLVLAWPERTGQRIDRFIDGGVAEAERVNPRKVLGGFAEALAHLERCGYGTREVSDINMYVDPTHRGYLVLGDPLVAAESRDNRSRQVLAGTIRRMVPEGDSSLFDNVVELLRKTTDVESLESIAALISLGSSVPAVDPLARFTDRQILRRHAHGETFSAKDETTGQRVVVKFERGRSEDSWVTREARALNWAFEKATGHVPRPVTNDDAHGTSFLAVTPVEGVSLSILMDSKSLETCEQVVSLAEQLLDVLHGIHPDVERIQQLLDSDGDALSSEALDMLGELRSVGIAHNHISPSNIFLADDGRVTVLDFVRAGRLGQPIPSRNVDYWPEELPRDVSDPRADLFCTARILSEVLSGLPETERRRELFDALDGVFLRVQESVVGSRFGSAAAFRDVLRDVAGSFELTPLKSLPLENLHVKIREALALGDFRVALDLVPAEWARTRAELEAQRDLAEKMGIRLLTVNDVVLSYVGEKTVVQGSTVEGVRFANASAACYRVQVSNQCVLELQDLSGTDVQGNGFRFLRIDGAIGELGDLSHAVRSLRSSVLESTSGAMFMEVRQAQIKSTGKFDFQASMKTVDLQQLSLPMGDLEVLTLLKEFGAEKFGTRAEIMGETNKRRGNLAVVFGTKAVHLAAVVHLITRVVPLHAGIKQG